MTKASTRCLSRCLPDTHWRRQVLTTTESFVLQFCSSLATARRPRQNCRKGLNLLAASLNFYVFLRRNDQKFRTMTASPNQQRASNERLHHPLKLPLQSSLTQHLPDKPACRSQQDLPLRGHDSSFTVSSRDGHRTFSLFRSCHR